MTASNPRDVQESGASAVPEPEITAPALAAWPVDIPPSWPPAAPPPTAEAVEASDDAAPRPEPPSAGGRVQPASVDATEPLAAPATGVPVAETESVDGPKAGPWAAGAAVVWPPAAPPPTSPAIAVPEAAAPAGVPAVPPSPPIRARASVPVHTPPVTPPAEPPTPSVAAPVPATPALPADERQPIAGPARTELPRTEPPKAEPPATGVPVPEPGNRGRLWAAVAAAAVILGAAAGGIAYVGPQRLRAMFTGAPAITYSAAPQPVPSASPVLGSLAGGAAPTAADVGAALSGPVAEPVLGPSVSVSVVDVLTGDTLFAKNDDHLAAPASTTKMATAAAVLATRGPEFRIRTTAVSGPNPGEVVLVGAGDPTLTYGPGGFYPGAGRLDQLAAEVKAALGGQAPTKLIYDTSLYVGPASAPGWDPDSAVGPFGAKATALAIDGARVSSNRPKDVHSGQARVGDPDLVAAQAFAKALGLPKSAVEKGQASGDARQLGAVQSPTVESLIQIMLEDSDNVLAEALARQVALARGKPAGFVESGQAILDTLKDLGVPVDGAMIVDGSGLSRKDRETPKMQTALLALAAGDSKPELRTLVHGLPVAGWSGTMEDRNMNGAVPQAGAGVVRAKTGTLSSIACVSGLVVTKSGRLLAFAILADQVPAGPNDTQISREGLDVITNALASL